MKGFVRNNQYLSLCGLNCKLCPMNLAGHCSGCGVDNQSCKIAKCSIEHGKIEYCFQCTSFPCDKYAHIDDFDSFITHHNQMNDMEKASQIGIPAYNAEQEEKRKLLDFLLSHYNDGRRKNLFCVAVNLLTIKEIENILQTVKSDKDFQSMGKKEQACPFQTWWAWSAVRRLLWRRSLYQGQAALSLPPSIPVRLSVPCCRSRGRFGKAPPGGTSP